MTTEPDWLRHLRRHLPTEATPQELLGWLFRNGYFASPPLGPDDPHRGLHPENERLSELVEEFKRKNSQLVEDLNNARDQREHFRREIDNLRQRNDLLVRDNGALTRTRDQLVQESEYRRRRKDEAVEELRLANQERDNLRTQNEELRIANAKLRERGPSVDVIMENDRLLQENAKLLRENAVLRTTNERLLERKDEANERIRDLDADVARLADELEKRTSERDDAVGALGIYRTSNEQLQSQVYDLREEIGQANEQNNALRRQLSHINENALPSENARLREELRQAVQERDEAVRVKKEWQEEVRKRDNDLQTYIEENELLRRKIQNLEEEHRTSRLNLQRRISELIQELHEANEKLHSLNDKALALPFERPEELPDDPKDWPQWLRDLLHKISGHRALQHPLDVSDDRLIRLLYDRGYLHPRPENKRQDAPVEPDPINKDPEELRPIIRELSDFLHRVQVPRDNDFLARITIGFLANKYVFVPPDKFHELQQERDRNQDNNARLHVKVHEHSTREEELRNARDLIQQRCDQLYNALKPLVESVQHLPLQPEVRHILNQARYALRTNNPPTPDPWWRPDHRSLDQIAADVLGVPLAHPRVRDLVDKMMGMKARLHGE